jgi:hypothetical protein
MSACHANVSLVFVMSEGAIRIATGYALSPDGLWRQHSWGVDSESSRVVETTVRRVCYYGFALNDAEILDFVLDNIWFENLVPEGQEDVIQFVVKFAGLPSEEAADLVKHAVAERPFSW